MVLNYSLWSEHGQILHVFEFFTHFPDIFSLTNKYLKRKQNKTKNNILLNKQSKLNETENEHFYASAFRCKVLSAVKIKVPLMTLIGQTEKFIGHFDNQKLQILVNH